jgi:hypothetical protein
MYAKSAGAAQMIVVIERRPITRRNLDSIPNTSYLNFVKRRVWYWLFSLPLLPCSAPFMDPAWPGQCDENGVLAVGIGPRFVGASTIGTPTSPATPSPHHADPTVEWLRRQSVCIAWNRSWSGQLGDSLLFHAVRTSSDEIVAGYFAYWSTERPWGDNDLTRQFVPALAIDAFYSHLFFVFPGVQRMMYGPGDIEGIRVTYRIATTGRLIPISVHADDERHEEVRLRLEDAVDESGRVVVLTDVWSHQLGAKGAVQAVKAGAQQRCFSGNALRGLTAATSDAFRLGNLDAPRRARPAWRIYPSSAPQLLAHNAR